MFARTSGVILGIVGAFALGLAVGPQITANPSGPAVVTAPIEPEVMSVAMVERPAPAAAPRLERVLPATAEPVRKHVRHLLNRGSDVEKASVGFHNAREFMTVAYAARNTEIPFVLLKHRVLNERMSLGRAIRTSKPQLDEAAEVSRARAEAKADLARLSRPS